MKILLATDAWYPQVNGVVRTLERTRDEAPKFGASIVQGGNAAGIADEQRGHARECCRSRRTGTRCRGKREKAAQPARPTLSFGASTPAGRPTWLRRNTCPSGSASTACHSP